MPSRVWISETGMSPIWSWITILGSALGGERRRLARAAAATVGTSTCQRSSSDAPTNVIAGPRSIPKPTRMPGGSIARASSSSGPGNGRTRGSIGRMRLRAFFQGISGSNRSMAARTVS